MPYAKGESGNINGRPKGSTNKINEKIKEVLEDMTLELLTGLNVKTLTKADKIKLISINLNYVRPRLKQTDITTDSTGVKPLDVILNCSDEEKQKRIQELIDKENGKN